jgi:hypothetical protein
MSEVFRKIIVDTHGPTYAPAIFQVPREEWKEFQDLCDKEKIVVLDAIERQLKEWARISLPYTTDTKAHADFIAQETAVSSGFLPTYGNWIYYPWHRAVVHLLPKNVFFAVRTNRNREKITTEEQIKLRTKRIGVAGLSVGHESALVLVQEALCGEIRIADFDDVDLSNLNRLRTSLVNLGVPKAVLTAREIAEIDPYLTVKVFSEGVTEDNIDRFFLEGGALDLVVEEIDSFHMKIKIREAAKVHGIPVVMDTNDRGLLDIERFDKEPDRPLLHGLLAGYTFESAKAARPEDRVAILCAFLGGEDKASPELRLSLKKIGTELVSYPQLSSDIHLGAALNAHAARRILLGKLQRSGRYYVDLQQLLNDTND